MRTKLNPNLSIITLLLIVFAIPVSAQSPKRGLAYGYHTQADMNVLNNGITWWYNWSSTPDAGVADYYQSLGVEFVPMFWNNNFNIQEAIENIPAGAKYILAYNEPNFYVEANMSPQYAASVWNRIEQVAAARGLQIISAAPAYCGGTACPTEYYDPTKWHDDFFAECPDCWVDYIAFHTYEGNPYGAIALTNNLKKYERPIWVTEFANWDSNQSQADKIEHMQIMVNAYENDPDIFRYSWFTGRSSSNPSIDILGANGTLTPLGEAYLEASYTQKKYNIPGKIEAENHYRRNRTRLENTTDTNLGQNVSHIDAGDWGDYLVQIEQTGSYTFQFRVASLNGGGKLNILLDGQSIKTDITIPATGDWQSWTTVEVPGVALTGGEHLIRLYYSTGGFNLNYFSTIYESGLPANADFTVSSTSTCTGNEIIFTDVTSSKSGGETYSWNFGSGASPQTAIGIGPHTVTYSTSGLKTVSLSVTNSNGTSNKTKSDYIIVAAPPVSCLFSDGFDNNAVKWITPIPGAFSHSESNGVWTISNNGYGEWENFRYTVNNGTDAAPINFTCSANKPLIKVKAKASGNCLLTATLVDGNGRAIDNYFPMNMELSTGYQTFTIDFAGHFRNNHSGNPGVLDSSNIVAIQFAINPAYYSYPHTGSNATYNTAFGGTVDIDWIGIGDHCDPPVSLPSITSFSSDCLSPGMSVTITGTNLNGATNVSFNDKAGTITNNTSTQLIATVPTGVTSGKISISTAEGTVVSSDNFNIKPVTSSITGPSALCENTTGVVYSVNTPNGSSYVWTIPTGATITGGSISNSITVNVGSTGGNITVKETNAAGCSGTLVSKTITVNTKPTADAGLDQTISTNTATLAGNEVSGTWELRSGTGIIEDSNDPYTKVNGLKNGTHIFRWTVSNSNCSAYDEVAIFVSMIPIGTISGPTVVLKGTEHIYSVTGSGELTWTVPAGAVITEGQGTNTIMVTFSSGTGGTISVTDGETTATTNITVDTPTSVITDVSYHMELFPNPFKESTVLRINSTDEKRISIKVIDVTGETLYSSDSFTANESIPIGNEFNCGIYFVIINYAQTIKTYKIVKVD